LFEFEFRKLRRNVLVDAHFAEREKISHWLAASWIRFGRMPDAVREMRVNKNIPS